jgi:hypothetical protein
MDVILIPATCSLLVKHELVKRRKSDKILSLESYKVFLSEVCLSVMEESVCSSILAPYYVNIINVFVFVKRCSIETKKLIGQMINE